MSFNLRLSTLCLGTCLLAAAGCENPADNVAQATVADAETIDQAPAADTGDAADQAGESLVLSAENTTIEFVGSKVTGSHDGGFKEVSGNWKLTDDDPAQSRLEAEIDMNSTWSDSDNLTAHLKNEDFFDVEKFPTSKFVSTKIAPLETPDENHKDATHTVTGNLTLHGVTKSISFPAQITIADAQPTLKSEFHLNRKDFDIVYTGKADDLIRDEVVIKLTIDPAKSN